MTDSLVMVREFHEAFDIPYGPRSRMPRTDSYTRTELFDFSLSADELAQHLLVSASKDKSGLLLRMHLCLEELGELANALAKDDPVEALDALAYMRYVADGAIHHLGFASVFNAAMTEVHASNMSKLVDGKPIKNHLGRVLKPASYFKPDLTELAYSGMEDA